MLRIFEMVLTETTAPHRAFMSDIAMMLLFNGGRERTAAAYDAWRLARSHGHPPISLHPGCRPNLLPGSTGSTSTDNQGGDVVLRNGIRESRV